MRYVTSYSPTSKAFGVVALIALLPGTGGAATAVYFKQRGDKGYPFANHSAASNDAPVAARTPADNLAHIRAVLKPAVTELAAAAGVSRQTIYDWEKGASITPEHAATLEDLARAADVFAAEGLTTTRQLLRRPLREGKSLFELVREGGSAEEAARSLLGIARRELEQRQALDARLRERKRGPVDLTDMGVPHVREEG